MTFAPLLPDYGVGDGYGFMFSVLLEANYKWQEFHYFVQRWTKFRNGIRIIRDSLEILKIF